MSILTLNVLSGNKRRVRRLKFVNTESKRVQIAAETDCWRISNLFMLIQPMSVCVQCSKTGLNICNLLNSSKLLVRTEK